MNLSLELQVDVGRLRAGQIVDPFGYVSAKFVDCLSRNYERNNCFLYSGGQYVTIFYRVCEFKKLISVCINNINIVIK